MGCTSRRSRRGVSIHKHINGSIFMEALFKTCARILHVHYLFIFVAGAVFVRNNTYILTIYETSQLYEMINSMQVMLIKFRYYCQAVNVMFLRYVC